MDPNVQKLLDQIKCQLQEIGFTQSDVDKLDLCVSNVPTEIVPVTFDDPVEVLEDPTGCVERMQDVITGMVDPNVPLLVFASGKIQELLDHLDFVGQYYINLKDEIEQVSNGNTIEAMKSLSTAGPIIASSRDLALANLNLKLRSFSIVNKFPTLQFDLNGVLIDVPGLNESDISIGGDDYSLKLNEDYYSKQLIAKKNGFSVSSRFQINSTYDNASGILHHQNSGYPGLYWKLSDPLNTLFTKAEEGLTLDVAKLDPTIDNADAGKVAIGDDSYYIENFDLYSNFFSTLNDNLKAKIKYEREHDYASALTEIKDAIKKYAKEWYYYQLRLKGSTSQRIIQNQDVVKLLSDRQKEYDDYLTLIKKTKVEIDAKIDSTNSESYLVDKIKKSSCFGEDSLRESPIIHPDANDPLGIDTLVSNSDPHLPGPTTKCYWVKVAKILTKINLLPLPGDKLNNPFKLRYWPVGLIIPTPKIIKIPFPHIWKCLAVINGKFGTIVIMLAQCGIVPSPFIFYLSPTTGRVSIIASIKGPQGELGYNVSAQTSGTASKDSGPAFKSNLQKKIPSVKKSSRTNLDSNTSDKHVQKIRNNVIDKISNFSFNVSLPEFNADPKISSLNIIDKLIKHVDEIDMGSFDILDPSKLKRSLIKQSANPINQLKRTSRPDWANDLRKLSKKMVLSIDLSDLQMPTPPSEAQFRDALKKVSDRCTKKLKDGSVRATPNSNFKFLRSLQDGAAKIPDISIPSISNCTPAECKIISAAPIVSALFDLINNLIHTEISKFKLPNISSISQSYLVSTYSRLLSMIPSVSLPPNVGIDLLSQFKFSSKMLSTFSIPTIEIPGLSLSGKIKIDLNKILKPLIKNELTKVNFQYTPGKISSSDIEFMLNSALNRAIDPLKRSIDVIIKAEDIFNSAKAGISLFESSNPILLAAALVKAKIKSLLSWEEFLGVPIDLNEAKNKLSSFKMIVNPINIVSLAALTDHSIIRNMHPVLNYDDLPPWERLSEKNPLFLLMIDSILTKAADVTGIVLGRSWK